MSKNGKERTRRVVEYGETRACDDQFGVVTATTRGGGARLTRTTPCDECPWRMDLPVNRFPAEAFRESAPTAYDMAMTTFGCHMSKRQAPASCAGFLLRHAVHNLGVRLSFLDERFDLTRLSDGGMPIYRSYREMAIANGVDPMDPVLVPIRGNDDP